MINTEVPHNLLWQARVRSSPFRPVVFVRYYPQMHRWITFHAELPLVSGTGEAGALVCDARTGGTFAVPPAHAGMLQQIFGRLSGGVSFTEYELKDLEQTAAVFRVTHLVYGGTSAGHQPLHAGHHAGSHHAATHPVRAAAQMLSYRTVPPLPGQKNWKITWHLSHPSPHGGWIVQHIVADFVTGQGPARHMDYWEAWKVPSGSALSTYLNADPNDYDDMFLGNTGSHLTGSARFYEGLTLPPSFTPNNAATAAGVLPATAHNPRLPLRNSTSPVKRDWTAP